MDALLMTSELGGDLGIALGEAACVSSRGDNLEIDQKLGEGCDHPGWLSSNVEVC